MKYSHAIDQGILKLVFSGDLIGENNGPDLVELINDTLNNDVKDCIINISDVRYINSSGIGVLITILTKFRNKSGDLYLINPSEHVKKLLIITKLQAIFNIVDSEQEALTKIAG
ncbi:STAS domain-containing protein [Marinoscillum sp. MHG1-6]|uniref:STAS domain-containing protein n=1 Tax=Marinoscillum sp. MHG1-6 TaxID=2959627 RepID=UPI002157BE07|nr:STAS domain-containing protein [Marinoscillum sp. MHG1-6]